MPVSQSKLARLTPNLGFCESRCALSDYVDQVANPIIYRLLPSPSLYEVRQVFKGTFVWDQSGIRIIGIMQVSVCLGAVLILDGFIPGFHSGYSVPRSRIAGIYSGIHSYSGVLPNERALSEASARAMIFVQKKTFIEPLAV